MFAYSDENVHVDCYPSKVRDVMKPRCGEMVGLLGALCFRTVVASRNRYNKVRRPQLGGKETHTVPKLRVCVS